MGPVQGFHFCVSFTNSRQAKFTDVCRKRQHVLSPTSVSCITIVNSCARKGTDSLLLLENQLLLLTWTPRTIAAWNTLQHRCRTLLLVLTPVPKRVALNFDGICVQSSVPCTCAKK